MGTQSLGTQSRHRDVHKLSTPRLTRMGSEKNVVMSARPVMELYHQKSMGNSITWQKKNEITSRRPLIRFSKLS